MMQNVARCGASKGNQRSKTDLCSLLAITDSSLGLVFFYWSFWVLCCEKESLRINGDQHDVVHPDVYQMHPDAAAAQKSV